MGVFSFLKEEKVTTSDNFQPLSKYKYHSFPTKNYSVCHIWLHNYEHICGEYEAEFWKSYPKEFGASHRFF